MAANDVPQEFVRLAVPIDDVVRSERSGVDKRVDVSDQGV
jgi:hypothetical protein